MVSRENTSRGQIILVGAIALAVIIAGLSVTLNSVMVSEVQPGGNHVETVEDAEVYRGAIAHSLQRLNKSVTDPDELRANTSLYASLLRNSTLRYSGASLNITVAKTDPTVFSYTYQTRVSRINATINTSKVRTSQ